MQWESWSAFWAMGGRAWYVWGSYFVTLALVVFELAHLFWSRRRSWNELRERFEDEALNQMPAASSQNDSVSCGEAV